jgi:predicted transposase YdaD
MILDMNKESCKWRDLAWKKALSDGARDAIAYFMPDLAADMDASGDVTAISGMELPVIGSDTEKGMRLLDVFLNVPLRNGDRGNVALLVEQQHRNDESFALRMLEMYVRLREKSRLRATALAIFTGDAKNVDTYADSCYGVELSFRYNTFHLPGKTLDELKRDKRPFARVVLAGRMSLEAGDDVKSREKYAWEILNMTGDRDYDKEQMKVILNFSRGIFRLNEPEISEKLKEAYKMKTIPLEDYVREIVREEGREEGKLEVARSMLADELPVEMIRKYTGLEKDDILSLG